MHEDLTLEDPPPRRARTIWCRQIHSKEGVATGAPARSQARRSVAFTAASCGGAGQVLPSTAAAVINLTSSSSSGVRTNTSWTTVPFFASSRKLSRAAPGPVTCSLRDRSRAVLATEILDGTTLPSGSRLASRRSTGSKPSQCVLWLSTRRAMCTTSASSAHVFTSPYPEGLKRVAFESIPFRLGVWVADYRYIAKTAHRLARTRLHAWASTCVSPHKSPSCRGTWNWFLDDVYQVGVS